MSSSSRNPKYRIIAGHVGKYGDHYKYALQKRTLFGNWRTTYGTDTYDGALTALRGATGTEAVKDVFNGAGEHWHPPDPKTCHLWLGFWWGIGAAAWVVALAYAFAICVHPP